MSRTKLEDLMDAFEEIVTDFTDAASKPECKSKRDENACCNKVPEFQPEYIVDSNSKNDIVHVICPGIAHNEIKVSAKDNKLIISYGGRPRKNDSAFDKRIRTAWKLVFNFSKDDDQAEVTAKLSNGILYVFVPKLVASKEKTFTVN